MDTPQERARALGILSPTPWILGAACTFWVWRIIELRIESQWGIRFSAADVLGFVWDALLVADVFAFARLATRPSERRSIVLRGAPYAVSFIVVFAAFIVRAGDAIHCKMTGGHWASSAFLYLTASNLSLLRDGNIPYLLATSLVTSIAFVAMLALDARSLRKANGGQLIALRRGQRAVALAAGVVALALPLSVGFGADEEHPGSFVPEATFLHEWLEWRGALHGEEPAYHLPAAAQKRFAELGLIPRHPLFPGFPLSRANIDPNPFPFPKSANAAPGPPNVVFVLVEQLSHEFVSAFSGELPLVMPELSEFARRATMVTEYQSVVQPTIHAIVTTLCSIHSSASYKDLNHGHGKDVLERTPLSCLPAILKAHGYRTVYLQGASNKFAGTAGFLRAHGFDEIYDNRDLKARYPNAETSGWGPHDEVVVDFAEEKIKELEAQRAKDGRPFFVMAQTIDMHAPGHPPSNCPLPEGLVKPSDDSESKMMIRTVHCTDHALGGFARFVADDPARSHSTILAITGDHPTNSMSVLRDLHARHGDSFVGWYGRMPLILYDGTHDLPHLVPVLSGHLDLAPTLLHMVGLGGVPNAMSGYSIFGLRAKYPLLVGRMAPKYVALHRPGKRRNFTMTGLVTACKANEPIFPGDPGALTTCELSEWVKFQDAIWREKRISPTSAGAASGLTATR